MLSEIFQEGVSDSEGTVTRPVIRSRGEAEICVLVDLPLDQFVPLGSTERYTFFVRALARRAAVKIIFVGSRPASVAGLEDMNGMVASVDATSPVARPSRLWVSRLQFARHFLLDRFPLITQPRIRPRELLRLIGSTRSVVVLCYRLMHLPLALPRSLRSVAVIEEATDRYPVGFFAAGKERWRRLAWRAEQRKTERTYRDLDRRAAAVVAISGAEADHLREFFRYAPVHVVPDGIDIDYFRPAEIPNGGHPPIDVLVVGDFNSPFNSAGACQVYEACRTRESNHRRHWAFIGPGAPPIRHPNDPHVEIPGYVHDLRPYYARAKTVLVPASRATGIKKTLLQAWAMERPVVASSAAGASLGGQDGIDMLVGSEPDRIAEQIERLLRDKELRDRIRGNGAARVREEHNLSRISEQFADLVLQATRPRQPEGAKCLRG